MSGRSAFVALLILSGIATWMRTAPAYDTVFGIEDDVVLLGVDALFHVRHAEYSTRNFPHHQRIDPGSHFPRVRNQKFSGLYNLGIAGTTRLVYGQDATVQQISRVAAWSPVVLAVLSMLWLYFLIAPVFGRGLAILGCSILVLFPGYWLAKTSLGFADQHVIEVLFSIGMLWGLVCSVTADPLESIREGWKPLLWSLPVLLMSMSWIGYPLFIVFFVLASLGVVLVTLVSAPSVAPLSESTIGSWTRHPLMGLAWLAAGAALWFVLATWLVPSWLLNLQKNNHLIAIVTMVLLAGGLMVVAWTTSRITETRIRRLIALGFIALVVVGGAVSVLFTPIGKSVWHWITWVRGTNVSEQQIITLSSWLYLYGPIPVLATVGALIGWRGMDSTPRRLAAAAIIIFSVCAVSVWLRSRDFDYLPAAFQALLFVVLVAQVKALDWSGRSQLLAGTAFLILCVGLVSLEWMRTPWMYEGDVRGLVDTDASWLDAAAWLEEHTPADGSLVEREGAALDSLGRPAWGVFNIWDHGNVIALRGKRAPAYSRYPTRRPAAWMLSTNQVEADSLWCPFCTEEHTLRYAALSHRSVSSLFLSHLRESRKSNTIMQTGYWNVDGAQVPRLTYQAYPEAMITRIMRSNASSLNNMRMVWESDDVHLVQTVHDPETGSLTYASDPLPDHIDLPPTGNEVLTEVNGRNVYDVYATPDVRILERVSGAVVRGTVSAGTDITASIAVASSVRQRVWNHEVTTTADSLGVFELRLPYSTGWTAPGGVISTGPIWSIALDSGASAVFSVSEVQVTRGDTIQVIVR